MTEREQAMARLQDLPNRLTNPEDLLHACLSPPANYVDYTRSDREPVTLLPELEEEVKILYQAVAVAPELSSFAKKRICLEACEKFLATVMSKQELDAFKKTNALRDNYDPNFLNLTDALARVENSGIRDTGFGQGWNLAVAAKIVKAALGDIEISEHSCDQLWKHLARHFKDECGGSFEDGHHANDVMSRAANRLQTSLCYVANSQKYRVEEPIDFTEFEANAFRD
jgi:hypothetical protein